MERLPDEMLEALLSFLDTGELLRARGVCRRWRDAALSPRLWAARGVSGQPYREAALRLAPCLRLLDLRGFRPTLPLRGRCAALELHLHVDDLASALWALEVLHRQVALGRLRSLRLTLHHQHRCLRDLWALVDRAGLETLHVVNEDVLPLEPWAGDAPQPARTPLRQLLWTSVDCGERELLLESMLEAHADSLEAVTMRRYLPPWPRVLARLPRCPRLRRLGVALCEELLPLDLRPLTHLQLDTCFLVGFGHDDIVELLTKLAPAFRGATQLEELTFVETEHALEVDQYWSVVSLVVEAIASSGRAALRSLRYSTLYPVDWAEVQGSGTRAASPLPRLRTLELPWMPPQDLLLSGWAPGLRLLSLSGWLCPPSGCALPRLRLLLAALPRLHIQFEGHLFAHSAHCDSCADCCARTGHAQLDGQLAAAFYAHPVDEPCDLHSGRQWLRLE